MMPASANDAIAARASARHFVPIDLLPPCPSSVLRQRCSEPRKYCQRIRLEDLGPIADAQPRGVDVALGVVIVEAGLGIDAPDCADYLRGEQNVLDRQDLGQQIDAGLVIDTGIEEYILQQMIPKQRLLHVLRQAAIATPMIGNGTAAVRNDEFERGK